MEPPRQLQPSATHGIESHEPQGKQAAGVPHSAEMLPYELTFAGNPQWKKPVEMLQEGRAQVSLSDARKEQPLDKSRETNSTLPVPRAPWVFPGSCTGCFKGHA